MILRCRYRAPSHSGRGERGSDRGRNREQHQPLSWLLGAIGDRSKPMQPVATLGVSVSAAGYRQLRRFAGRWPQASWAIEGAGGLGAPLAARLSAEGIAVVDVPAKLAA